MSEYIRAHIVSSRSRSQNPTLVMGWGGSLVHTGGCQMALLYTPTAGLHGYTPAALRWNAAYQHHLLSLTYW